MFYDYSQRAYSAQVELWRNISDKNSILPVKGTPKQEMLRDHSQRTENTELSYICVPFLMCEQL
jgi:hypothetical protein